MLSRPLLLCCILLAGCVCLAQEKTAAPALKTPAYLPVDPLNAIAFNHFYNLEYDRAVQEFQQILQRHPDDPFAVNHLITGILFRELYRMGAMNTGEYTNNSFIGEAHRPADPKIKQEIQNLVQRAEGLEQQELNAKPNNVLALYARGVSRGLFAIYTALIDRAWFSALRNAVGARRDHERVLELDPNYTDAKLIVGAHNYVMGSLPWSVKVAVALVGLSGNKEKGLRYLREDAEADDETSTDAKIVLALFLRREHRYAEALQLMRGLVPEYPRNILFALEVGNLLRAKGEYAEAAKTYEHIWEEGRDGHYSGLHYEIATFALGDLLRSEKDYPGAIAALERVNEVKSPDPEIAQKANLAMGEIYDAEQQRDLALQKYQAVVAENGSSPQADVARKCMKQPCRE